MGRRRKKEDCDRANQGQAGRCGIRHGGRRGRSAGLVARPVPSLSFPTHQALGRERQKGLGWHPVEPCGGDAHVSVTRHRRLLRLLQQQHLKVAARELSAATYHELLVLLYCAPDCIPWVLDYCTSNLGHWMSCQPHLVHRSPTYPLSPHLQP